MPTKSKLIQTLALCLMASFATVSARAEISQQEQLLQAQKAYEESAKDYEEVAAELQTMKDAAEVVRDTAKEALDFLGNFN